MSPVQIWLLNCWDSSVGRAEDWKSSCHQFKSGSWHITNRLKRYLYLFKLIEAGQHTIHINNLERNTYFLYRCIDLSMFGDGKKKKNKLSKKLPSLFYIYRSWRIEKVRIYFIHSKKICSFFISYFLSYLFYFFILVYATFKGSSKWHARYKVHSAELFWFIYYIVSAQMKFIISSKLGNTNEVFFSLVLIRIRIQLFSFI